MNFITLLSEEDVAVLLAALKFCQRKAPKEEEGMTPQFHAILKKLENLKPQ